VGKIGGRDAGASVLDGDLHPLPFGQGHRVNPNRHPLPHSRVLDNILDEVLQASVDHANIRLDQRKIFGNVYLDFYPGILQRCRAVRQ
jgi:hypothetical protein